MNELRILRLILAFTVVCARSGSKMSKKLAKKKKTTKQNRNRNRDSNGCRRRALRRSESAMGGFVNRPSPKTPVQSSRTGTADHATLTRNAND